LEHEVESSQARLLRQGLSRAARRIVLVLLLDLVLEFPFSGYENDDEDERVKRIATIEKPLAMARLLLKALR
jgi:hypothetical protein